MALSAPTATGAHGGSSYAALPYHTVSGPVAGVSSAQSGHHQQQAGGWQPVDATGWQPVTHVSKPAAAGTTNEVKYHIPDEPGEGAVPGPTSPVKYFIASSATGGTGSTPSITAGTAGTGETGGTTGATWPQSTPVRIASPGRIVRVVRGDPPPAPAAPQGAPQIASPPRIVRMFTTDSSPPRSGATATPQQPAQAASHPGSSPLYLPSSAPSPLSLPSSPRQLNPLQPVQSPPSPCYTASPPQPARAAAAQAAPVQHFYTRPTVALEAGQAATIEDHSHKLKEQETCDPSWWFHTDSFQSFLIECFRDVLRLDGQGDSVLDVVCGTGTFTMRLADDLKQYVYGFDPHLLAQTSHPLFQQLPPMTANEFVNDFLPAHAVEPLSQIPFWNKMIVMGMVHHLQEKEFEQFASKAFMYFKEHSIKAGGKECILTIQTRRTNDVHHYPFCQKGEDAMIKSVQTFCVSTILRDVGFSVKEEIKEFTVGMTIKQWKDAVRARFWSNLSALSDEEIENGIEECGDWRKWWASDEEGKKEDDDRIIVFKDTLIFITASLPVKDARALIKMLPDARGNLTDEVDNTEALGGFLDLPLVRGRGQKNLDLGGGPVDDYTTWLWENWRVKNRVHDIYARDPKHNKAVEDEMFAGNSPSVTSLSVLNVVPRKEDRKKHIQTAFDALVPGGRAFFKVYRGDGSKVAGWKKHEIFFQNNQPASCFLAEIQAVFQGEGRGGHVELLEDRNLIIATKPTKGSRHEPRVLREVPLGAWAGELASQAEECPGCAGAQQIGTRAISTAAAVCAQLAEAQEELCRSEAEVARERRAAEAAEYGVAEEREGRKRAEAALAAEQNNWLSKLATAAETEAKMRKLEAELATARGALDAERKGRVEERGAAEERDREIGELRAELDAERKGRAEEQSALDAERKGQAEERGAAEERDREIGELRAALEAERKGRAEERGAAEERDREIGELRAAQEAERKGRAEERGAAEERDREIGELRAASCELRAASCELRAELEAERKGRAEERGAAEERDRETGELRAELEAARPAAAEWEARARRAEAEAAELKERRPQDSPQGRHSRKPSALEILQDELSLSQASQGGNINVPKRKSVQFEHSVCSATPELVLPADPRAKDPCDKDSCDKRPGSAAVEHTATTRPKSRSADVVDWDEEEPVEDGKGDSTSAWPTEAPDKAVHTDAPLLDDSVCAWQDADPADAAPAEPPPAAGQPHQGRRGGRTFCGDDSMSRSDWLVLCENTLSDKGWPKGVIMQVSGCRDEEESADTQDSAGQACGACTQSFLHVMSAGYGQMSWAGLLNEQRRWLEVGEHLHAFTQLPKISISAWDPDPKVLLNDLSKPASFTRNTFSAASGRRRALLIGINYQATDGNPHAGTVGEHPEWALDGCVPDQRRLYEWLRGEGWRADEMTMLLDCAEGEKGAAVPGEEGWPSRPNIERELRRLVDGARDGDFLWLSFSGHGVQKKERRWQMDEIDGMEEALFCGDGKQVMDDWLSEHVMRPLPEGGQLFCLMDCCHSGTMCDLPLDVRLDCKVNETIDIVARSADGKSSRTKDGAVVTERVPFDRLRGPEHGALMAARIEQGRTTA